ncbi:hypothetical protein JTE90_019656 [Oedothorax gibbosus]|uniref:Uncharacterized protein n=1 Tax=Oedothorax gibbosus TaxID=931172 RepID=A0AAV6U0R4_9ARAC|nr:hypothetical protein JTE90_019656 [Oedothorax gibbosus]
MFRDRIMECVRYAKQSGQGLLTIIKLYSHTCNLEDLDEHLLRALFKCIVTLIMWIGKKGAEGLLERSGSSSELAFLFVVLKADRRRKIPKKNEKLQKREPPKIQVSKIKSAAMVNLKKFIKRRYVTNGFVTEEEIRRYLEIREEFVERWEWVPIPILYLNDGNRSLIVMTHARQSMGMVGQEIRSISWFLSFGTLLDYNFMNMLLEFFGEHFTLELDEARKFSEEELKNPIALSIVADDFTKQHIHSKSTTARKKKDQQKQGKEPGFKRSESTSENLPDPELPDDKEDFDRMDIPNLSNIRTVRDAEIKPEESKITSPQQLEVYRKACATFRKEKANFRDAFPVQTGSVLTVVQPGPYAADLLEMINSMKEKRQLALEGFKMATHVTQDDNAFK